jgi:competence protein ComEA
MNGDSPHFSPAQCRIMLVLVIGMLALCWCRFDRPAGTAAPGLPAAAADQRRPHFVVELAGAVARPGVYCFFHQADWAEALRAAGGLKGTACLPAEVLHTAPANGSMICIGTAPASTAVTPMDPAKRFLYFVPFGINQASAEELRLVPGIGETTARAIVSYRERHGGFSRLESLLEVPGIGRRTFAAMKDYLTL